MKPLIRFTLASALVPITVLTVGLGTTRTATATPTNPGAQAIRSCTPQTCTPYRANYEKAIARGIIRRPSLVSDHYQAIQLGDQALQQSKPQEAASRYAQALVIISETQGNAKALAFERRLEAEFLEGQGKTLRQVMPLFGKIFPVNGNPYR
ncbi:MAG: hypothetical protein AB1589_35980 [Cyanobacteriota bacterium]